MKTKLFIKKAALVAAIAISGASTMNAQMFYKDSHLFVGQKPAEWNGLGDAPGIYIGPEFGVEYSENGLNLWKPYPSASWGNYKVFVKQDGKVGIGRKPATYALEVSGQVWTTGGLLVTSDNALKRNIASLGENRADLMGRLMKLGGKSYEKLIHSAEDGVEDLKRMAAAGKISEADAQKAMMSIGKTRKDEYKKEFGFIAQEMREVFPELVEEGGDGVLAINYTGMIPVCLKASRSCRRRWRPWRKGFRTAMPHCAAAKPPTMRCPPQTAT